MKHLFSITAARLIAFGAAGGAPAAGRAVTDVTVAPAPQTPPSASQQARWDDALDRYEKICRELLSLKLRVAAGETVDVSETAGVAGELNDLRILLSHGNGEMTDSQKARFEAIGKGFSSGNMDECGGMEAGNVPAEAVEDSLEIEKTAPAGRKGRFYVLGLAGYPPMAGGAMLIGRYGLCGGYVKVLGTMTRPKYAYTATSDGRAEFDDGINGFFWGKEGAETIRSSMAFSCGLDFSPAGWIDVYAGVGYGWNWKCWTDMENRKVLVSDLSFSGVVAETGAVFNWKMLSATVGLETIAFRTCTPFLGVGVNF